MSATKDGRGLHVWQYPLPPPDADARQLIPGFETLADARDELAHRVKRLRQGNREQRRLAGKLERCREGRRCDLSICPLCKRRGRLWVIGQTMVLMENDELAFGTVVTMKGTSKAGELDKADPTRLLNQLRKQLVRCGFLGLAIGEIHGAYDPERCEYSVHIHFITSKRDRKQLELLRPHYPRTATGSAGLVIRTPPPADGPSVIGYCFKGFWVERARYQDKSGKIRTKKRRLRAERELEWLTWQARYAPSSLFFLFGVRRHGDTLRRCGIAPAAEGKPDGRVRRHSR